VIGERTQEHVVPSEASETKQPAGFGLPSRNRFFERPDYVTSRGANSWQTPASPLPAWGVALVLAFPVREFLRAVSPS
jgi:hypothetical protein